MKRRHNAFELLIVSEVCAFAFAIVFVVTLSLSLPRTDGAYGQAPFGDPLVAPVMSIFASIAGLLAWPFMYVTLWNRRLRQCLPIVLGVTLAWIIVVTPLHRGAGMLGSFVALGGALVLCRGVFRPCFPQGHCAKCGYNLTGNLSGRCPECNETTSRAAGG
jgi:hypothetical protein